MIFLNKRKLKRHENKEHKEKNDLPECDQCSKSFSNKYDLQKHVKIVHTTDPGNGKCDQCEKEFKQNRALSFHVRTFHEGKVWKPCFPSPPPLGGKNHATS